jgi:hypothetical protein
VTDRPTSIDKKNSDILVVRKNKHPCFGLNRHQEPSKTFNKAFQYQTDSSHKTMEGFRVGDGSSNLHRQEKFRHLGGSKKKHPCFGLNRHQEPSKTFNKAFQYQTDSSHKTMKGFRVGDGSSNLHRKEKFRHLCGSSKKNHTLD